jgi:hypothetical protein
MVVPFSPFYVPCIGTETLISNFKKYNGLFPVTTIPTFVAFTSYLMLISACTGGTGSAKNKSIINTPLGGPVTDQIAVAYIKRPIPEEDDSFTAINPGAHLYVRDNASISAEQVNLSAQVYGAAALYDVKDLQVSEDGNKLLFAMHAPEADIDDPVLTWNIWEYDITSNQLYPIISDTLQAEEGNDVNPFYLPTGEIGFSSTRQSDNKKLLLDENKPQYSGQVEGSASNANAPDHALVLHKYNPISKDITQLSYNQSHDYEPILLQSGEILYTRQDDIANNNRNSLYRISPNGANTQLVYGYQSQATVANGGPGLITNKRETPGGNLIAILSDQNIAPNTLGGDLVKIDIDNYVDLNTPTPVNAGLSTPAITSLAASSIEIDNEKSPGGRYLAAWPLHDGSGRILVSWSPCRALDAGLIKPCSIAPTNAAAAPPFFGLWNYDSANQVQQPVVLGEEGMVISDVAMFESREPASYLADQFDPVLATTLPQPVAALNIRSVYDIDGIDGSPSGILNNADPATTPPDTIEAKFLRLVKAVSIPDEDVLDFDNSIFGVSNNQLMREIIGYVPIEPDGSVRTLVPAQVPLMIDIVDRNARRIHPRHENWIHFSAGEIFQCQGCHANGNAMAHGRDDAQPASAHPGATAGVVYSNTTTGWTASAGGETMAELYSLHNSIAGRTPSVDVVYTDEWSDETLPFPGLTKAAPFSYLYQNLSTAAPTNTACQTQWHGGCRITINYEAHIQPIWEATRTPIDDGSSNMVDSCIGCHTSDNGARIPAGQLELTNQIDPLVDRMVSYQELLATDAEQALNNGALTERRWQCNIVVDNQPVPDGMGGNQTEIRSPDLVTPSMSTNGANFGNSSTRFFSCMENNNLCENNIGQTIEAAFPDECVEIGGTPLTNEPIINHNDMLSADELRLISEWLDIGAQYYNNPFDAP